MEPHHAQQNPAFKPGDHARLTRRYDRSEVLVLEDRGLIGWSKLQYYRIRVLDPDGGSPEIEVPEEELVPVTAVGT